jgi:hypothetical protein
LIFDKFQSFVAEQFSKITLQICGSDFRSRWIAKSSGLGLDLAIQAERLLEQKCKLEVFPNKIK